MFKKLTVIITILLISVYAFAGSQQTSSTTAATIILNARAYLNDEDATDQFCDDTELLQWLNDGLVDLVGRSHCLETTEDITLIADQAEYSIVGNYMVVKAIHYVNSSSVTKALIRGTPASVGRVRNVVEPAYWYDWAGNVGVYPVLTSVTTEKITVYYISRPTAIISSAVIPIPAIYDKALTMYVVGQAWAKDRQMSKYAQAMSLYQSELNRYRQDFLSMPQEPAR